MKIFSVALFLFVCSTTVFAQHDNAFAAGDFQSGTSSFQFRAREGTMTGDMTYSDPTTTLTVAFNCVVVSGNRAAMSGTIVDSSDPMLIGQQSLLAVEDNGNGQKSAPDAYVWLQSTASDCHAFPLALAAMTPVDSGRIHVKPSNVTF